MTFPHLNGKKQLSYQFIKKQQAVCLKLQTCLSSPNLQQNFRKYYSQPVFTGFIGNNLIFENQSGFKSGDSCINQLLAITHEIFSSFDDNYEVRRVFLDIAKAFHKVWHEGIIHKLKRNRISGNLLSLLTNFLRNRKQRVILNDQSSSWVNINAWIPQGSILGPLLFLIYISLMIYLIIFNAFLSYLLTRRPCFLLLKYPKEQLIT